MVSIDWQSIIAYLLLGASGLGGVAYAGKFAWGKWKALPAKKVPVSKEWAADEPSPTGAVSWAQDVVKSMGDASAQSKLDAILSGFTRAQAMRARISELEAKP